MQQKNMMIIGGAAVVVVLLAVGAWLIMGKKVQAPSQVNPSATPSVAEVSPTPNALTDTSGTSVDQNGTNGLLASPGVSPIPALPSTLRATAVVDAGVVLTQVFSSSKFGQAAAGAQSQTTFTTTTPAIYLTIFAKNVPNAAKIAAQLQYVKSGDVLGPVATNLVAAGTQGQLAEFKFTKPTKGWPTGQYKATVFLQDGKTVDYFVTVN